MTPGFRPLERLLASTFLVTFDPMATRETPGDETPGDEIPGDVRPLATRETPGDDDPWTYGLLAMKWFGGASTT